MKTCTKCKIEKPLTEFHKSSRAKDGLQFKCRSCAARYRAENVEKLAAARRAHYLANRERSLENQRAYRSAIPDVIAKKRRAYHEANRERITERHRAYKSANPGKIATDNRNRRARLKGAEGYHSEEDVNEIFTAQRGMCASCHEKLFRSGKSKRHVDHIMPLALGGSNWPSNLQLLCPACNTKKGAKHPDEWAKIQGRLL